MLLKTRINVADTFTRCPKSLVVENFIYAVHFFPHSDILHVKK